MGDILIKTVLFFVVSFLAAKVYNQVQKWRRAKQEDELKKVERAVYLNNQERARKYHPVISPAHKTGPEPMPFDSKLVCSADKGSFFAAGGPGGYSKIRTIPYCEEENRRRSTDDGILGSVFLATALTEIGTPTPTQKTQTESFSGNDGEFGGGGASGSWDTESSPSDSGSSDGFGD